jgi:hypothetical protein
MNLEDLAIGWREALLAVIALLVLYVAVVVIRLRRLRSRQEVVPVPAVETTTPVIPESPPPAAATEPDTPVTPDFPWNEPPDAQPQPVSIAPEAALLARLQVAEDEVRLLREELAVMRSEMAELRADLGRQLERVQATQHVAPIYGDAMQLAAAGYDAATIAERCGVARAEAELVVALIRNRDNNETMRER